MNVFKTSLLATALIAGGVIAPAHAANNQDFFVLIDIDGSCHVTSTENVDFENVFANAVSVDTTSELTVQCTRNQAYHVQLDGGQNSGNDINARQMLHEDGVATIAYQLHRDSATGPVWGQTNGTDTETGTGTGFGPGATFDQPHTVYATATIPGTALAGAYTDTIKATVTF